MLAATWRGNRRDPDLLPPMTPAPFIRRVRLTPDSTTCNQPTTSTMTPDTEYILDVLHTFVEYMDVQANAIALWVAGSGIVAAAYLAGPLTPFITTNQ